MKNLARTWEEICMEQNSLDGTCSRDAGQGGGGEQAPLQPFIWGSKWSTAALFKMQ